MHVNWCLSWCHTLVFPISMCRCESWTVKNPDLKKFYLKYSVGGELNGYLDFWKDEQVGLEQSKPVTALKAKTTPYTKQVEQGCWEQERTWWTSFMVSPGIGVDWMEHNSHTPSSDLSIFEDIGVILEIFIISNLQKISSKCCIS